MWHSSEHLFLEESDDKCLNDDLIPIKLKLTFLVKVKKED